MPPSLDWAARAVFETLVVGLAHGIERNSGEGRERLERLGIGNVPVGQGDGLLGWAERGPFDRIVLAGPALPLVAHGIRVNGVRFIGYIRRVGTDGRNGGVR